MLVKGIHGGIEYPMTEVNLEVGDNKEIWEIALSSLLTEEDVNIGTVGPFFNDILTHDGEQRRKKDGQVVRVTIRMQQLKEQSQLAEEELISQPQATLTPWNELVGADTEMTISSRPKQSKPSLRRIKRSESCGRTVRVELTLMIHLLQKSTGTTSTRSESCGRTVRLELTLMLHLLQKSIGTTSTKSKITMMRTSLFRSSKMIQPYSWHGRKPTQTLKKEYRAQAS